MEIDQFFNVPLIEFKTDVQSRDTFLHEFSYACNIMQRGYLIEFGVWKGISIRYMAAQKTTETIYGFDTFEGLKQEWNVGSKIIDMRQFAEGGIPNVPNNVVLIKGMFQDTLPDWCVKYPDPIAFINIDSDIYRSAKFVLRTLNSQILPGTIIRFDELTDWSLFKETRNDKHTFSQYTTWEQGEWKALNEWLEDFDRQVEPAWRNWHQSAGIRVVK